MLYTAVPKLATPKPFYLLDPATISEPFEVIATGDGTATGGAWGSEIFA